MSFFKPVLLISILGLVITSLLTGCVSKTAEPTVHRKGWVDGKLPVEEGFYSFKGISLLYATRQGANNNAEKDVTNKVARYISTAVIGKFRKATKGFGLEGEIQNPGQATKELQDQMWTASVQGLEMIDWYNERETRNGKEGYLYYVLARIPKENIQRSYEKGLDQSIKEQQAKAEKAATEKAKRQFENAAKIFRQMKAEGW